MLRPAAVKKLTALAAAVLLLAGLCAPVCAAAGTARRTVRVGLPASGSSRAENRVVTYEKEYLQAVAQYAGWDYVYVSAPWAQCLAMAASGELDVLLNVARTDARAGDLDFSNEAMGTETYCLIGTEKTRMHFDDYAAFDGMTVGCAEGSAGAEALGEYSRACGFSFTAKSFASATEMFAALDSGSVDAVVQNNFYEMPAGHVVLAKCAPSPVYIATSKKNPALKKEADAAMARLLGYDPSFNADLYRAAFGSGTAGGESFTNEELAYLAGHPVVNVPYETNWAPFEYDSAGTPAGITPDVIRAIGRDTGITFRFVEASSTQAIYREDGGAADTVMAVSCDYVWANSHDLLITQPYVSGSVMCVTRDADEEPHTVAVVQDGYLEHQVRREYPGLTPVSFQTFPECMDAVANGAADCTFLNYYQANYYRSAGSRYDSFSYRPAEALSQSIALGVTRDSNPLLLGILAKSLQRISAAELQGILSENAVQTVPLSLHALVRRYPMQMALIFGLLCVLLCTLAVLLFTARTRKRRSLALARATRDAEDANRAKSDFLSRMSHDIRTPLNGIIGMTHIAAAQGGNPPRTAECLGKIDTSSRFLLGLVNEILDMSKAESGKMELRPEPYSADAFRAYIDAVIRPLCEGKHQTLTLAVHTDGAGVPLLDILRTNQVFFNLLSNAVKYTPEGGAIAVDVDQRTLPGGRTHIAARVSDNGIGMSSAFQKVLFDPFTQEHRNDNSEMRGTGLGLAIVKKIMDAMGGSISVHSEIGKGTEFRFEVECPCVSAAPASSPAPAAPPAERDVLRGRHILLCEDHPLNQEIALALLGEKGMLTDVAENGEIGVKRFAGSAVGYYDAVLMDIRMPVMNGFEAARAMRALPRADAKTVPILAMTADAFEEDVQRCLDAGMNGHVAKPIDPEALYAALRGCLQAPSR